MKRIGQRPLPFGTAIEFCGEEAIVTRDDGGSRIEVLVDGCIQNWWWTFEGASCSFVRYAFEPGCPVLWCQSDRDTPAFFVDQEGETAVVDVAGEHVRVSLAELERL